MKKSAFLAAFCAVFLSGALFAKDLTISEISDDSALRFMLAKTWFIETPREVLQKQPITQMLDSGERVQIRVEAGPRESDEFSIIIARERNGTFPGWAQGSFILSRRISDGHAIRARVFLRSDPYTYIQFRPLDDSKSEMDALVYDAFVTQALPIKLPFSRLMSSPLNEILNMAGPQFPRRYYEPNPDDYRDVRNFVRNIRRDIKGLSFIDDGAINEDGVYVFIETEKSQDGTTGLNCSGFAKWVIDGMIYPISGENLMIGALKEPYGKRGSNFTLPFERIRDPYFGLDWTRNLAAAIGSTLKSDNFASLSEIEVQNAPFSALLVRSGQKTTIRSYPEHLAEAGFDFTGIQPLLYSLAIDEPRYIFLGAINTIGGRPSLRTYFHIVILVPYFDENSDFRIAIFESAEETSFNRFKTRYPGHYINLSRVPVTRDFQPFILDPQP
ncbi:MAG: hypothetical protein LBV68_07175 [Spirochaetaceae bacterium]|jgi:hypothetical protein|nr:hypothetical protein [Spirochaetaceae bacterium]